MQGVCVRCKGRLWCGLQRCPLVHKKDAEEKAAFRARKEMFGPTTGIFVGHHGYPEVFVGPMVTEDYGADGAGILDDPGKWYGRGYEEIIDFRTALVFGRQKEAVSRVKSDFADIAMSRKPFDLEVKFEREPRSGLSFGGVAQPMGPTGELKKMKFAGNPEIPKRIDSLAEDGVKVRDILPEVVSRYDVYYLQKVLSSGAIGEKKRMVPTRWSITAVDKMIADLLIERVKECRQVSEFLVFSNEYLYNHFEILVMPGAWSFEQFEAWHPGAGWNPGKELELAVESEGFKGRSDYAEKEGGGYYAGRLGCAEGLSARREQGKAVVFREILEGYTVPVGVWEVRENVRKAFLNEPKKFQTRREAFEHLKGRLRVNFEEYLKRSSLLGQKRLNDYSE